MKRLFSFVCAVVFMASCASGPVAPVAVQSKVVEDGGTGPYKVLMFEAPGFEAHTVFAPQDLSPFGKKNKLCLFDLDVELYRLDHVLRREDCVKVFL